MALAVVLVNLPMVRAAYSDWRLDTHGQPTIATVTDSRAVDDDGDRRYFLAYQLSEDADPEQRAYTAEVDRSTYQRARSSEELEVSFVPGHPTSNRATGRVDPGNLALYLTIAADLALVGFVALMLWSRGRAAPTGAGRER